MKLTTILLLAACLQLSARGLSQSVTYSAGNVSIDKVFKEVTRQTGYQFFYRQSLLKEARPLTIRAEKMPLEDFLKELLKNQPFEYSIENRNIILSRKAKTAETGTASPRPDTAGKRPLYAPGPVSGRVSDPDGKPLAGATVTVKSTGQVVLTARDGFFTVRANPGDVLIISYVGFAARQITLSQKSFTGAISVLLQLANSPLDDVQIIAYGTTSKRLNTSSSVTVKGETLNNAPVSNPLAALEGRAAGVVITQTSGVPGAAFKVQIRGRTRVDDANGADEEPLYIVDGVPMSTGNSNINLIGSAISATGTSGLSPFATINMADIESIDILKDADATAIYGSRGASGVILITTRKAKAGAMRFDIKGATGGSRAKLPDILNTKQYVAMRKEAFKNDNIAMTNTNAYDLLLWDTTRDNNLARQLIGGTASFTTAEASVSGGTTQTQYMVGGGYYRETDVYPGEMPNTRASGHVNLTSKSADQKFTFGFIANYTATHNQTSSQDLAFKLTLPPNYRLYDSVGNLAWNEKGIQSDNPLAYLLQKYDARTTNLNANVQLGYRISQALSARVSVGYNAVRVDERKNYPKTSLNPNNFLPGSTQPNTGTSYFGNNNFKSWIVEPQLEYNKVIGSWGKIDVLAGATMQDQRNDGYNFQVNNYTSDDFLGTLIGLSPASFTNASSVDNEYKYAAVFGRVNYNYGNKYILNFSGRRDGSSRFGPDYRYSNFAAAGGAWLFSSEDFMKRFSFLSFGKLRASYGVTGNDKIGDYKYIDLYSSNIFSPTYRDSTALSPTSLFRPDLHWERNKKLEFGLDLGFFSDRLLLNLAWYRNRSNDPLVQYPLPTATGFSTITANLNSVVVENTGYEITLNTVNIRKTDFDWSTSFNITIPENKLLKFPGLAASSYASKFIIGKPLSLVYIARYLGVDPQTGLSRVDDINKNGTFQVTNLNGDLYPAFDMDPKVYGGIQNDLRYKNFRLNIFLQFNQQYTQNWRSIFAMVPAGGIGNVPVQVLDRWQKPGDLTNVQKFTTVVPSSTSLTGNTAAYYSDDRYTNAFYLRLKTVMLSYTLPAGVIKKMRLTGASVFMQGQNLFTFSPFSATDPETAFITRLSPLTTITAGLQLNF